MPRKPRFFLPNVPVHMMIRGNNRQVVFTDSDDFFIYKSWLREASESLECRVHAYVLMSNHIHLLVSAEETSHLSKLSQAVGRRYVPYFNHKYGKSGSLWEGRFKAASIDSENYLMACYRYIELNPVRALMVTDSQYYEWSSYHANALGKKDTLVTPHPLYKRLGKNKVSREMAYKALVSSGIEADLITKIQQCTQTGVPLGKDKFIDQIESLLKVKVGHFKQGRPLTHKGY